MAYSAIGLSNLEGPYRCLIASYLMFLVIPKLYTFDYSTEAGVQDSITAEKIKELIEEAQIS